MFLLIDRGSMRFIDVNPAVTRLLGYSREEMLAMGPQDVLPVSRAELEQSYDALIASPSATGMMNSYYRCKDGSRLPFESTRRVLRSGGNWIIAAISRDIRERIEAQQALRDSEARFRQTFELAGSGIAHVDLDGHFLRVNRSLCAILGYASEELVGRTVRELSHPEDLNTTADGRARVRSGELESARFQKRYLRKDGATVWVDLTIALVRDGEGRPLYEIAVFDDDTERVQAEERIQRLAHHDSLTGLPNRLLFNDRLLQAISLAKRDAGQVALLYLDLDGFKPVNDALGHAAGDELLQGVAARIRRLLRDSDTVARIGGDEFTVILPGIGGREEAEAVAGKITAAVAAPYQLGGKKQSVNVGTSIGVAVYPADGLDADALIKAADAAMYSVKQAGNGSRFRAA
jgi:diguanylate cyclase (GGDEF)-like protein/PAS domain S-box-containing protein